MHISRIIMNRGRRGGRARGVVQRTVNNAIRREARHDAGQGFTPSLLPPDFVRVPWNSFTFSSTVSGSDAFSAVTVKTIRDTIIGICGISNTAIVQLKIERARVWNISRGGTGGFSMPNLYTRFYELTTSTSNQSAFRTFRNDHGTLDLPAKAGYLWPLRDRTEVLSSNEDHDVMSFKAPSGTSVVVMINCLWRSTGAAALDSFDSPVFFRDMEIVE